jgi:hypothetical protein
MHHPPLHRLPLLSPKHRTNNTSARPLSRSLRERDLRVFSVEQDRHLLETVAPRLGVEEIHGDDHDDENGDKDEVVAPPDGLEGYRVDENVEEYGEDGGGPCCG